MVLALALVGCDRTQSDAPPLWAYPVNPKATDKATPTGADTALHIDNSKTAYTSTEIHNLFAVPDWRPEEHPPMPAVVAAGRKPDVMACGYCHLSTGDGRTENASLAGLPRDYIVAQMRHFADGSRTSSVGGRAPTALMVKIAKAATDREIEAAASYFSSLRRRSYVHVVEAATIPKVAVAGWVYRKAVSSGQEPIGQRVVETPDDFEQFEKRDPGVRYTAFVPPGSIKRGEEIARHRGVDGTAACSTCHGADLRGSPIAPPLAGRSPTYIVRQLYDFQTKSRAGDAAAAMQPVVKPMGTSDMIAVSAYLGSLRP
jgi:cytochrome c553